MIWKRNNVVKGRKSLEENENIKMGVGGVGYKKRLRFILFFFYILNNKLILQPQTAIYSKL